MHVQRFEVPRVFQEKIFPMLLEHEAEYNLLLGVLGQVVKRSAQELPHVEPPLMYALEQNDTYVGAAIQTPPYNLVLTDLDDEAAQALAVTLVQDRSTIPGIVAPRDTADRFADAWHTQTGAPVRRGTRLFIYAIREVLPTPMPPGKAELATPADAETVTAYIQAFCDELGLPVHRREQDIAERISEGRLMLWKNPGTVAMASCSGPTPNGIRVNFVYVPPEHRRHGYATGVVSALTKKLLDSGRRFCFLFVNADDPAANAVYTRIGYTQVAEFAEYLFEPVEAKR